MFQRYRLGLRALKSAIAVFLCLLIGMLLKRSELLLASIAALICMQPTYDETYKMGLYRLIGTSIGGAVGLCVLLIVKLLPCKEYINYISLILAPFCVLTVIYICNVINHKSSIVIGCIVTLSVIVQWSDSTYSNTSMYVINRVLDTSMGVVIAMLVNRFLFRKKINYHKKDESK